MRPVCVCSTICDLDSGVRLVSCVFGVTLVYTVYKYMSKICERLNQNSKRDSSGDLSRHSLLVLLKEEQSLGPAAALRRP